MDDKTSLQQLPLSPLGISVDGNQGVGSLSMRQAYEVHTSDAEQHRPPNESIYEYLVLFVQSTRLLLECPSQARASLVLGHDVMQIWYSKLIGPEAQHDSAGTENH